MNTAIKQTVQNLDTNAIVSLLPVILKNLERLGLEPAGDLGSFTPSATKPASASQVRSFANSVAKVSDFANPSGPSSQSPGAIHHYESLLRANRMSRENTRHQQRLLQRIAGDILKRLGREVTGTEVEVGVEPAVPRVAAPVQVEPVQVEPVQVAPVQPAPVHQVIPEGTD